MAVPASARSTTTSGEPAATTSHTVDMPATIGHGDLLLTAFSVTDTGATTDPGGWTQLGTHTAQGNRLTISAAIADGTEDSGTEAWTTAGSAASSHITLAIKDWHGSLTEGTGWDISTGADGSSTFLNPELVTSSWGSDENFFIAISGYNDDDEAITAWPPNYDDNQISSLSGGGAAAGNGVAVATRTVVAASQNPGSFRTAAPQGWNAFALSIRAVIPGGIVVPSDRTARHHLLTR